MKNPVGFVINNTNNVFVVALAANASMLREEIFVGLLNDGCEIKKFFSNMAVRLRKLAAKLLIPNLIEVRSLACIYNDH